MGKYGTLRGAGNFFASTLMVYVTMLFVAGILILIGVVKFIKLF